MEELGRAAQTPLGLEVKHTPGPWSLHMASGWVNADHCCGRGPMHVADVRGWGHLTGHGHGAHAMKWDDAKVIQEANGRLIAAAPEMLEALEECLAILRRATDDINDVYDARYLTLVAGCRVARAAILKATSSSSPVRGGSPNPTIRGDNGKTDST